MMIDPEVMILAERLSAESHASQRLLNIYLREMSMGDPRFSVQDGAFAALPTSLRVALLEQGTPARVVLPASGITIFGGLRWFSPGGHHRYGARFWQQGPADPTPLPLNQPIELARLILDEMAACGEEPPDRDSAETLIRQIENSIERSRLYLEQGGRSERPGSDRACHDSFVRAEQSVLLGHPFHPTPKSSEGFTRTDLERYAPELGASFQLHYFAAAPGWVEESWLPGEESPPLPRDVRLAAARLLVPERQGWPLLPCHPWQARYLLHDDAGRELLADSRLMHLGPLGAPVFPTSSVRTVYLPEQASFFKLPLKVRITNLVRVNPPEELHRALDVSRLAARLADEGYDAGLTILLEQGYRTLSPPGYGEEMREEIAGSFAVLFREAPPCRPGRAPRVLAGLLEPLPRREAPPLVEAVRLATGCAAESLSPAAVRPWLRCYLEHSMIPLLRLFIEQGLSLEAHVQNTLVELIGGWPTRFYLRDLEGASISRERGRWAEMIPADSPALYEDGHAWHRLKYYFFVNHLGHLLSTLSWGCRIPEEGLWAVVRSLLETHLPRFRATGGGAYIEELLDGRTLPAKANLLSRLHHRGERPLYVDFPNPLLYCEVSP